MQNVRKKVTANDFLQYSKIPHKAKFHTTKIVQKKTCQNTLQNKRKKEGLNHTRKSC